MRNRGSREAEGRRYEEGGADPNAFTPIDRAGVAGPAVRGTSGTLTGAADPRALDQTARPGIAGPARSLGSGRVVFTNPDVAASDVTTNRGIALGGGATAETTAEGDLLAGPSVRTGLGDVRAAASSGGRLVIPQTRFAPVSGVATGNVVITNEEGRTRVVRR